MATIAKISDLKIGDVVSFNHYGGTVPAISDGVIIGTSSGTGLRAPDIAAINHANTYPAIPTGSIVIPNDYTQYSYLTIKTIGYVGGEVVDVIREIGIPWIIPATVTRQYRQMLSIQIQDFDETQLPIIHKILNNNGFNKYTATII